MLKKVLPFVLLACALTFAACSGEKEEETTANKAIASTAATPEPPITYPQGFYDLEGTAPNSWRWMSELGVVRLKNTGTNMKLHIVGEVPVDSLKEIPTYKVALNGETLEEFTAKIVDKEFVIPAAKLGSAPTSELTISSNKYFVPKQIDPKSTDERKLSLSLRQLTWEAQ